MTGFNKIILFCREKEVFSVPLIQSHFSISYTKAAAVVDAMVREGLAASCPDGLSYVCTVEKEEFPPEYAAADGAEADGDEERDRLFCELFGAVDDGKCDIDPERLYNFLFEGGDERRRPPELPESFYEVYCVEALRLCIDNGYASALLVRKNLPVDYSTACSFLGWMMDKVYISSSPDSLGRFKVYLSDEDFNAMYSI